MPAPKITMANATWFRTALGFVISPISPGLLSVLLVEPFHVGEFGRREFSEATWVIGLFAVLGYPVAVAFGLPLYVFLRARGWTSLVVYIIAGALLVLLVYVVYVLLPEYFSIGLQGVLTKFSNTALVHLPSAMICGAVATLAFWLIARPDRMFRRRAA